MSKVDSKAQHSFSLDSVAELTSSHHEVPPDNHPKSFMFLKLLTHNVILHSSHFWFCSTIGWTHSGSSFFMSWWWALRGHRKEWVRPTKRSFPSPSGLSLNSVGQPTRVSCTLILSKKRSHRTAGHRRHPQTPPSMQTYDCDFNCIIVLKTTVGWVRPGKNVFSVQILRNLCCVTVCDCDMWILAEVL